MSTPADAKAELRARMRRIRASIPQPERERLTGRVEEALFGLPEVTGAGTILLFYSFGTEISTRGMAERVMSAGKRLLLPYVVEAGGMEAAEARPGDDLVETAYGAREPPRRTPVDPADVDVVVTPGLAFDRRGYRLGYGAGYYDRYLARLGTRALRAGVAFSVQVVDAVPAGDADERVHLVVTDTGVIDCRD